MMLSINDNQLSDMLISVIMISAIMISVIMFSVIMLSGIMLSAIMLSVILNIVMLSVLTLRVVMLNILKLSVVGSSTWYIGVRTVRPNVLAPVFCIKMFLLCSIVDHLQIAQNTKKIIPILENFKTPYIGTMCFNDYEQLFEYKNLLLLKDIYLVVSVFNLYLNVVYFFNKILNYTPIIKD
jgi:hypothetical protein